MKSDLKQKYLAHYLSKSRQSGFTLIELLVVIIIIGILSAIALPSFLNQANKARQSEATTYIGSLNRGQQAYFLEASTFGDLSNLELGIKDTVSYTYSATPTDTEAINEATPIASLKGVAGRVYVGTGSDGTATTLAILCEGEAGATPDLAGVEECP